MITSPSARAKTLERLPERHAIEVPTDLSKAQVEKIRIGALDERIVEIARSVALEVGDDRVIEATERALRDRGLVQNKRRNRQRRWRRYTVYLDIETGDAVNALAKGERANRFHLIRDLLRAQLGLPPIVDREAAEE